MNLPKVSLLIPCHNISSHRFFSLKEAVKIKYPNLEILVLNDYSTDNTLEILNDFSKRDERIRVIDLKDYHEHIGLGFNRDFLINQAQGEYVLFLDDDDKIYPSVFDSFAKNYQKGLELIRYKYVVNIPLNKSGTIRMNAPYFKNKNIDWNDPKSTFINTLSFSWGVFIKKQFYLDICKKYNEKFDLHIFEDQRFMLFLYLNCQKYKYVNKVLIKYLLRPNSLVMKIENVNKIVGNVIWQYDEFFKKIAKFNLLNEQDFDLMKSNTLYQLKTFFWMLLRTNKKNKKCEVQEFLVTKLKEYITKYKIREPYKLSFVCKVLYKIFSHKLLSTKNIKR
ncbi:glycosyltransferase family 2 protein [Mycoplasmopsis caviae]|uniref:Glycosyltransferase family 2 protein n=1 Tax=Mycoplasmopsis caviae TaxID=55603 RepID=A0A3P8K9T0_9BACT|nr:glycosyltransferase family 2 protein [Mycoplasmopsis caviae]UUD35024.1 glycosyltransferase family 2 protein [Mycoplasmopsis caviae]VDR42149.1 Hyaluronan synthase [Mycoplasmopsis caviae]